MAPFWNKKETEVNILGDDNKENKDEVSVLQVQKAELSVFLEDFKTEVKDLKNKCKVLEEQNQNLLTENNALKVEFDSMKETFSEQKKLFRKLEGKLMEQEKKIDSSVCFENSSLYGAEKEQEALVDYSTIEIELKEIKKILDDNQYKDRIIKELHEELQKHTRNLYADITNPYLKNIIKIFERLSGTYKAVNSEEFKEKQNALFMAIRSIESDKLMVEDMLYDEYDMTYFEPIAGAEYLPKEHTAVQSVATVIKEQGGKVIECFQGGFRDSNTGKVFKNALVSVYKFENKN